jgi:predicted transcriptional regulator
MTRIDRESHLETLVADISRRMSEQHVSQAELARRMDTHPSAVCNVLKLKVDPRASTLIAMLKALGCQLTLEPISE